jgi:hypothetical protein
MNVNLTSLAKAGYLASDTTLAALARDYVDGRVQSDSVAGSYIKILYAHVLRDLERQGIKRASSDKVIAAVETVHAHMYTVILAAVTTPDLKHSDDLPDKEQTRRALERNRRSNFARSAKSTLVAYITAGGKLSSFTPAEVTKERLRSFYKPKDPPTYQERANRATARLESIIKALAATDMAAAREVVTYVQTRVAALVVATPSAKPRRLQPKGKTVRRGELTLTAH